MNKLQHVMTQLDEVQRTGVCIVCGPVRTYLKGDGWICRRLPPRINKRHGPSKGSGVGAKLAHQLMGIDEQQRAATCALCGPVRIYEAKGTRARVGQKWTCGRRPAERKVGGTPTNHQVSGIDEVTKTGTCSVCGPIKLVWRPYKRGGGTWGCFRTRFSIESYTAYKWNEDFKPAICPYCQTHHRWDRNQGIQCRERLVVEQDSRCAICACVFSETNKPRVDHDHATGATRGVLCRNCNVALGLFKDDVTRVQAALDYLKRGRA